MENRTERRRQERESRRQEGVNGSSKLLKRLAIWGGLVVFLALIVWGLIILASRERPSLVSSAMLATPVAATDQLKGNREASVTLVEYSDYQCPACAYYAPWVNRLAEDYGEDLAIVYRHFPLRSIHPNAQLAAQASEAAGLQGKFWEMSDLLFENQAEWSKISGPTATFIDYVTSLGLDGAKFETDLKSAPVREKVNADYDSGMASRVSGTPTFFLNGEQIENPRRYKDFAALVEQALNETEL